MVWGGCNHYPTPMCVLGWENSMCGRGLNIAKMLVLKSAPKIIALIYKAQRGIGEIPLLRQIEDKTYAGPCITSKFP